MRTVARKLPSLGIIAVFFSLCTVGANPAIAAGSCNGNFCSGGIVQVFADPSDAVVSTDIKGPCGSGFFQTHRTSINFKEVMAVFLTAFSTSRNIWVLVNHCEADRNIIDRAATLP